VKTVDLSHLGIEAKNIARNPATSRLYMDAIRYEPSTSLSAFGALIAYSGEKTGRSPSDKRITENAASKDYVWWGDINMPIGEHTFEINRERAKDYLNTRQQIYVIDAFAGLGSREPHQGPRHLHTPLPRAVYADHAHQSLQGGISRLRRT
jgi:phosphoenolpyruvate carboxykinase (ATP)